MYYVCIYIYTYMCMYICTYKEVADNSCDKWIDISWQYYGKLAVQIVWAYDQDILEMTSLTNDMRLCDLLASNTFVNTEI